MKPQGCQLWSIALTGKTGRAVDSCARTHTVHNPKIIYRETVLRGEIYKKTIVTNNKLKALLLVVNEYHRFFFQLSFNCTFNLFVFNLRSFVTCLICVEQCFFYMFFNCFVFFLFIFRNYGFAVHHCNFVIFACTPIRPSPRLKKRYKSLTIFVSASKIMLWWVLGARHYFRVRC